MKENFHVRFGERGGETRRPQGRKVRSAPTLRTGMISEYFSDQTGAHVTGIDFIPKAIQDAWPCTKPKRDRLDFRVMDISHLDFRAASFDVIVSVDTLYFTDTVETLRWPPAAAARWRTADYLLRPELRAGCAAGAVSERHHPGR